MLFRSYFPGIILANGGVYGYKDGIEILEKTKAAGLGIARGALGRPWVFKVLRTGQSIIRSENAVKKIALQHVKLAEKLKGRQGIIEMRKHLCFYVQGLPGARKMREKLVKVDSAKDVKDILFKEPAAGYFFKDI